MILALLLACRTATVVDACDADPAWCLPCDDDTMCRYTGNACTETVYCAQEGAAVAVIQIGCSEALEYRWPGDDTCRCVSGECRADTEPPPGL